MTDVGVLRPPATVLFGRGVVQAVGGQAAALGRRALVCTDGTLARGPQGSAVVRSLRAAGLAVDVLDAAVPELPLGAVEAAVARARAHAPDCVVGLGGGSSIDLAKLVALGLSTDVPLREQYVENAVSAPTVPVIAVPTTAGSGSEVTPVAVLSDPDITLKVGISSPYLVPRAAICDPALTEGAPPAVTAHAGIDALAHAIEAFTAIRRSGWADVVSRGFVGGNVLSDRFAVHAVAQLSRSLRAAVDDDPAGRSAALEGSLCAGLAFATAGTAAAHALQYPLGARTGTPHGLGTGLLLPYVMAFNVRAQPERLAAVAVAMGADPEPAAAIEAVLDLARDLGLPRTLQELGVERSALEPMAEQALGIARLIQNNPREVDLAGAVSILEAAWSGDWAPLSTSVESL